jgi:hypothetical protein
LKELLTSCLEHLYFASRKPAKLLAPYAEIYSVMTLTELRTRKQRTMLLAFNETQLEQIKTFAFQLPYHLRSQYLHHIAKLLPQDFSDADVWRAAHKAVHEVMHAATPRAVRGDAGDGPHSTFRMSGQIR